MASRWFAPSAMRFCNQSVCLGPLLGLPKPGHRHCLLTDRLRRSLIVRRSSEEEGEGAKSDTAESVFGVPFEDTSKLPTEYENDIWQGEQWEWLGSFMNAFIPIVIVLALIIGGLAASFYNEGAKVFVKSPTSEGEAPEIFLAEPGTE